MKYRRRTNALQIRAVRAALHKPTAVHPIAWLTPLHHGVELLRALCLTGDPLSALGHAAWLLAFSALLYPPAINLLRRRLIV